MDSKKPKWRRLELVKRGRTSKGKQWEDEQQSKKEKLMNIPHPCLYIAWMVSMLLDVGEV